MATSLHLQLALAFFALVPAAAEDAKADHLVPLTELTVPYRGEDGGLYGGGANQPPEAQARAAQAAAEAIRPLGRDGKPSDDGAVVLLAIGMSNTTQEFSRFQRIAPHAAHLAIVDGAQGGQDAPKWDDAKARTWDVADQRLAAANTTADQVQVAWIKQALAGPASYGPRPGKKLTEELGGIVRAAKVRYPNLRLAYLSSRIYAGYAKSQLNPEPYAYESAFAVRWLIQAQMRGDKELNADAGKGEVVAPVLLWGPYLWADGETPRADDKLVWEPGDFGPDGTHPSDAGRDKVAHLLLTFFAHDAYARGWFPAADK